MERVDPPQQEYLTRVDHNLSAPTQELDKNMRLDVLDFQGSGDSDIFLDWLHSIESFYDLYDIPEYKRHKFAEAKLEGTAKMWWDNYKDENRHLGIFKNWDDLKAVMRRMFETPGARKKAHLQLTQLQ